LEYWRRSSSFTLNRREGRAPSKILANTIDSDVLQCKESWPRKGAEGAKSEESGTGRFFCNAIAESPAFLRRFFAMWFEQKIAKDAKTRESPNLFAAFATLVFHRLRQSCGFAALGSLRFFAANSSSWLSVLRSRTGSFVANQRPGLGAITKELVQTGLLLQE
jgi:hypothetical protein